jgi:hypothetical protein
MEVIEDDEETKTSGGIMGGIGAFAGSLMPRKSVEGKGKL